MLKRMLTLAALGGLAASPAAAQRDFSSVEITSEEAAPGLWVLYGAGGNIGVHAGEDAVFLVDDQFAPLTDRIVAQVRELTGEDVDFVLNTHYHGDHTGGNENMGERGALIFGHENVRRRVIEDNDAPGNAPVVTFNDRQNFHINGETIRAHHVHHAHTDGDAFVYFENANVIHTGDLMFEARSGSFPFIDLEGGGSIDGAINAAEKMIEIANEDTVIIPGHGRMTDLAALRDYRAMLTTIRGNVQSMIDEGRSKEDIVAAGPAADFAEGRSGGFISEDRFVETVYESLTAE